MKQIFINRFYRDPLVALVLAFCTVGVGYDDRSCYSYIITLTDGLPTIQLPCNAGVLGMSTEEELPIAQSYAYDKVGGRYNVISVFDWSGNSLKHISLKNK